jgi:adenylosuccinate synthase
MPEFRMPSTVVVGGQFGSEGKGKVVALLAAAARAPWVVRCGGPNSGHTCEIDGFEHVLRQLPCGVGNDGATLLISAGCVVDEDLLIEEIEFCRRGPEQVIVDPRAVLLEPLDRQSENPLANEIGSTVSGTGAALSRRASRSPGVRLVKDATRLREYARIEKVAPLLHKALDDDHQVIVEGTQGFGLSLLHGFEYPYVTARDTTAAGFAMEVGLSPRQIDEIVMVVRTFPIRVAGNSGPLTQETSWETIRSISRAPEVVPEYTSVTKRLRRVGMFDLQAVQTACLYNRPTQLAVMGLDRLDFSNHRTTRFERISETSRAFLTNLQRHTGVPIRWVGTGFETSAAFSVAIPETRELLHA